MVINMEKIRWAICDDVSSVCKSFELALKKYQDLVYLGAACTSADCIRLCSQEKPDILLLDIMMEEENSGILLIPEIKRVSPDTKIAMLTSYSDETHIFSAFSQGADNYIPKSTKTEDVYTTMKNLYDGQCTMQGDVMQALVSQSRRIACQQQSLLYIITIMSTLSQSEFEILKEIYDGKTYSQIAQSRFVELGTIKKQSSRILHKFRSKNMKELIESLSRLHVFELYNHNLMIEDLQNPT